MTVCRGVEVSFSSLIFQCSKAAPKINEGHTHSKNVRHVTIQLSTEAPLPYSESGSASGASGEGCERTRRGTEAAVSVRTIFEELPCLEEKDNSTPPAFFANGRKYRLEKKEEIFAVRNSAKNREREERAGCGISKGAGFIIRGGLDRKDKTTRWARAYRGCRGCCGRRRRLGY